MARKARRATFALRMEWLESRTLLSGNPGNELFVRFVPNATDAATQKVLSTVGAHLVQTYPQGPELIGLPSGTDPNAALKRLRANPEVLYAEPDETLHQEAFYPNDPYFSQLYGLSLIDAPQAWSVTAGNSATVVAVLDTGIDFNSPDLVNKIWRNPNPGADGFPNDVFGWNFVNNNSNVQDFDGHGTHVSGILAAQGNNAVGVVGVNWNAQLMVIKVLDNSGNGSTDAAVSGIYYAVQHGARVINASWGGGNYSQALADAISFAGAHGVVFVTAAGNDGVNSDVQSSYPGAYRLSNELVVGAVDAYGNMATFSDFGVQSVDLAAPGVNIVSTVPGGYTAYSGTSMSTPYVSGVVALLVGINPGFTAAQLVQRIKATVKPLPGLAGKVATGGVVDAYNAISFAAQGTGATLSATGVTLTPNTSTDEQVLAKVLSTDSFYASRGGTDAAFVTGLYQTLAARPPDPAGLSWWLGLLQSGQSRASVALAFTHTNEALQVKVAHWYQDILGWTTPIAQLKSDPGVVYWGSLLASGRTDNGVLARILSSNDYYAAHGGTDVAFVSSLYPTLLGRAADPSSLSFFVGLFQQGTSRQGLVQLLETTVEAKRAMAARWYQEFLGWATPIDQLKNDPGVAYWAAFLEDS